MSVRRSYSAGSISATTRAVRYGPALVVGLLAVTLGLVFGTGPTTASAATLTPCSEAPPTGPIVEMDGEGTLAPTKATRKALRRSGVRQGLIRPASSLTGRPSFPVGSVAYGASSRIGLKGGIKLKRGRRVIQIKGLVATVPAAARKPAVIKARFGGGVRPLFQVKGGKRVRSVGTGELTAKKGTARLTAAAARVLNRKLGLKRKKKLKAKTSFGRFDLYSSYVVTEVEDPKGESPVPAPVKTQPAGSHPVVGATTIKWHVRDSWIDYVNTGAGTSVADGATADPPSGSKNLVYSFNFPFASGWTVPAAGGTSENTLIKGNGTIGFRFCEHTINFTVSDPEIELEGDEVSRLIFRVNGSDGTPFPDTRAVMVKLMPGNAAQRTEEDNGDGTTTVRFEKIPGFVPAEATGIFAGFYQPYDPGFASMNPRPDRFGFLDLTYTYRPD